MNTVRSIAQDLQRLFKGLPHLPEELRKTLAKYLYIFSIVLAVSNGLILFYFLVTVTGIAAFFSINGITIPEDSINIVLFLIATLSILTIVLFFMAYRPLQKMQEKGWLLLYLIALIGLLNVIFSLLRGNFIPAFSQLLEAGVGMYFLYEVREYFGKASDKNPQATTQHKKIIDAEIITKK